MTKCAKEANRRL